MTDEGAQSDELTAEAEAETETAEPEGTSGDAGVAVEPEGPEGKAAQPRRRWLVPAVVIATLAALLAASGVLGWQDFQQRQLDHARDEAQRAAISYAQVLTSVDSGKVDENFQQVLDGATGDFKDMYSKSSSELRQLLIENKATAHGVVIDSAVQSVSKDRAVVLLFVDQSVSNTALPDPRIDRSRMKMTLEKSDGRWRASKIELP